MPTMAALSKDDPRMIAWTQYKHSDDYVNAKRWATFEQHTEGSLWAAFIAGFEAASEKRDIPE